MARAAALSVSGCLPRSYFTICYGSIAAWAYAGARLRHYLDDAGRVRGFNRAMAALLALSAAYLAVSG